MTAKEIQKEIEASAHAFSAMSIFLHHAFCVLAQQQSIDLKALIEGIESLKPENENDSFNVVYTASKSRLLSVLKETHKNKSKDIQ